MLTITQSRIRLYQACPRAYYLKYVRQLVWPSTNARNFKTDTGSHFHTMVKQLLLGFPESRVRAACVDDKERELLDSFLRSNPTANCAPIYTEKKLTVLHAGVLWEGIFDVIAFRGDKLLIFDWKTTARLTPHAVCLDSPQTHLYRFIAKRCGGRLLGRREEIPAEDVEMIYWFPAHPDTPVELPYSEKAYLQEISYLNDKARAMSAENEAAYPMADDAAQCADCPYRTYCGRELSQKTEEPEEDPFGEAFQSAFDFPDLPQPDESQEVVF